MGLDDYLGHQREQRQREHSAAEAAQATDQRLRGEIEVLLSDFYARMQAAGNPGVESWVVESKSKGLRALLPTKVRGWLIPHTGRVLTTDWQLCSGASSHRRRSVGACQNAVEGFLGDTAYQHRSSLPTPQNVGTVGHQLALILEAHGRG